MIRHLAHSDVLDCYLQSINPPEGQVLEALRLETGRLARGGMSVAREQAQLLAWLAGLTGARRYLEIGVFTGYSSTAVAAALPEDGMVTACDVSVTYTDIARRYWKEAGVAHKIDLQLQPALITLRQLEAAGRAGFYDMALIDADKPSTPDYYEHCLRLVRPGGLIAADNVLLRGRVAEQKETGSPSVPVMRAFNAAVAADSRVEALTLPLGDGMTLIRKKR